MHILAGCFRYSKHSFIYDDRTLNTLSDGTPAQKSYLASKLNRFPKSHTSANRRRTAVPSKVSQCVACAHYKAVYVDVSRLQFVCLVACAITAKRLKLVIIIFFFYTDCAFLQRTVGLVRHEVAQDDHGRPGLCGCNTIHCYS